MVSILPGNFYLLSISNTNQPDTYTKVSINLFAPTKLKIEAGMPFTFNCEINGRMSADTGNEKQLTVSATRLSLPESNTPMQEIEFLSEDMNRVSYVTVYDNRAGDYQVSLTAKHNVLGT
jgi:hypothetical protein